MPFYPNNAVVWTEIPVTDLAAAQTFYETVLDTRMQLNTSGPAPMVDFKTDSAANGVAGHLLQGTPAPRGTGPTIHLAIPGRVEDAMARCQAAGGTVTSPVIKIPPGRFAYAQDPDGNRIGLFEPAW